MDWWDDDYYRFNVSTVDGLPSKVGKYIDKNRGKIFVD